MTRRRFLIKTRVYLSLMVCFMSFLSFADTGLIITYYSNTTQSFIINETSGKLYFRDKNLIVDEGNGLPVDIELSLIRKLNLQQISTALPDNKPDNDIFIYPNPANDYIRFGNCNSEKIVVRMYALSGKLMLGGEFIADDYINISHLASGLYLVRIEGKTFKLSKL